MIAILALVLGAVLAIALVRLARTRPPRGERLIYAVGLVVAAIVYIIFAIVGGARCGRGSVLLICFKQFRFRITTVTAAVQT